MAMDLPNLSDLKTPKMLHRHVSEPDVKTMREIERDLEGLMSPTDLPSTPPFLFGGGGGAGAVNSVDDLNLFSPGTEQDICAALGMPTDLSYAKTTPLHLDDDDIDGMDPLDRSMDRMDRIGALRIPPRVPSRVPSRVLPRGPNRGPHRSPPRGPNRGLHSNRSAIRSRNGRSLRSGHGLGARGYDAVNEPFYVNSKVMNRSGDVRGYDPMNDRGARAPPRWDPYAAIPGVGVTMPPNQSVNAQLSGGPSPNKKSKSKKRKKGTNSGDEQAPNGTDIGIWGGPMGFDFAVHDLNEQLAVLGKDTVSVDEQIEATNSKIESMERALKQTLSEKEGILKELQMERTMLRKSLNRNQSGNPKGNEIESALDVLSEKDGDEEGFGEVQIEEYWTRHCASIKTDIAKIESQNQAVSAASDVAHNALRSQLDGVRKKLERSKLDRATNRSKNMRFELDVIELSEKVNALRETLEAQRRQNLQRINKEKEQRFRQNERKRIKKQQQNNKKKTKKLSIKEDDRKKASNSKTAGTQPAIEEEAVAAGGGGNVGGEEVLNVVRVKEEYPSVCSVDIF